MKEHNGKKLIIPHKLSCLGDLKKDLNRLWHNTKTLFFSPGSNEKPLKQVSDCRSVFNLEFLSTINVSLVSSKLAASMCGNDLHGEHFLRFWQPLVKIPTAHTVWQLPPEKLGD